MGKFNFCDLDIDLAGEVRQLLFPQGSPVCSWCCIGVRNGTHDPLRTPNYRQDSPDAR